jgi:RNA polymerase sigma-70 factor (ECF subfamily)
LAYYLLCDEDAATEAVHNSLTQAFHSLESLQLSSFRNWLMRTVADTSCDFLRRQQSCVTTGTEGAQVANDNGALSDRVTHFSEIFAERIEIQGQLTAGIQSLPFNQRVALVLADICGFSCAEIGEICAVAPGIARIYLSQARARVRNILVRDGYIPSHESTLR